MSRGAVVPKIVRVKKIEIPFMMLNSLEVKCTGLARKNYSTTSKYIWQDGIEYLEIPHPEYGIGYFILF